SNSLNQNPPILTRTSLNVGCPTAAVILRTCRFFPSVNSSPIQHAGTVFRYLIGGTRGCISGCGSNIHARHGSVFRPCTITPRPSLFNASAVGIRSTCAQYSRSCAFLGCNNLSFNSASSLNNNKPSESASSRPMPYTPLGNPNSASVRFDDPSGVNCDTTPNG